MPKNVHLYQAVIVVLLLALGWVVGASLHRPSPETDLAAPGAPLYEYAVTESVKSMMSKQEQAKLGAEGRPPSPGPDYYWCKNCKAYHKRKTPASAGQPAVARTPGATPAASPQPAARPPSPGAGYYWCEHCKTYHKKQAAPNQHGAVKQGLPSTPVPHAVPAATPGAAVRPPSPGKDYYWCEKCETYHRRKPVAQKSVEKLILGGVTNSPNRNPLIAP